MQMKGKSEKYKVIHEGREIEYSVRPSPKRRTFGLEVHPDGQVIARTPKSYKLSLVEQKIKQTADWILRKLAHFQNQENKKPEYKYIEGEQHLYLGEHCVLNFVLGKRFKAHFEDNILQLHVPSFEPDIIKKYLYKWYHKQALIEFDKVLNECFAIFTRKGHTLPPFRIRFMRTRWGSLSPTNVMTLNAHLIRLPKACIEYVIMHELCHLEYRNHGPRFYKLLETQLPDWKNREKLIKTHIL